MTTTFKMPEPTEWHVPNGIIKGYTSDALRYVLKQAADVCEEKHWTWHMGENSGPRECAEAIHAMIKEIPE